MRRSPLARVGPSLVRTGPQFSRQYYHRVLRHNPIAFWPGWEQSGTNARCLVGAGMDGTWARDVATMGTGAGIGDGNTAALYDGTNDYCNIHSAVLAERFNVQEGSLVVAAKVGGVGVWTDGTNRGVLNFAVDANNQARVFKASNNNRIVCRYIAGGTSKSVDINGLTTVEWSIYALTWSVSADEVRVYYNRDQVGSPLTGLGTWVGALSGAQIGSFGVAPNGPWSGYDVHASIFDRALSSDAIEDLSPT